MTAKVHDLLISLNIPLNSYHAILCNLDESCSYLNDMMSSMSNEAEKSKASLYEAQNRLEEKNSKIESSELKNTNIMCDRDGISLDNCMLAKQRNI